MSAYTLMVQGTTSNAGKSALVTGLCRILSRQGCRVAPFKPQNMALNSAVTVNGGEIGRAQAVQAQACGLEPTTDMNPVLLKPNSATGAQVVLCGKPVANMDARSFHFFKNKIKGTVIDAYGRLAQNYDYIIVEGAGSPAEINLRDGDIANMGFAEGIGCPVILVADIDRGGVFAHLVGTMELLSESERDLVRGFVINRFRGDITLLQPGIDWLQQRTGKPVIGVLPFLPNLHLQAEDSLCNQDGQHGKHPNDTNSDDAAGKLKVVVPLIPHISNQTDFEVLAMHPDVELKFVSELDVIPKADLIILPGSKSVDSDLSWLKQQGWENIIRRHLRYGGKVLGICGGFQMLGKSVYDPLHLESASHTTAGFNLFDMETIMASEKQLNRVQGNLCLENAAVEGYEIHMGITSGSALVRPFAMLGDRPDGAMSADGQIAGTYLHGLFDLDSSLLALLKWAGKAEPATIDFKKICEDNIDRLADAIEEHLDLHILEEILQGERSATNTYDLSPSSGRGMT